MNLQKAALFRNLALCFLIIASAKILLDIQPVNALSVSDYFTLNYNITISTYNINEGQTFNAVASGTGTCKAELPISPSAAVIDSRVIATNQSTGIEVTLNPDYELNISPFPNKVGQTLQLTQTIPLIFPAGSTTGSYDVKGELISAKVDAVIWIDVSSYLPSSQDIGTVNYFANDSTTTTTTDAPTTTAAAPTTTATNSPTTTTLAATTTTTTATIPVSITTTTAVPTTSPTSTTTTTSAVSTTAVSTASSHDIADVSSVIDSQGIFTQQFTFTSSDGLVSLDIPSGTVGLTANGTPFPQISIVPVASPPVPSSGDDFIGLAYDFEPSGATFSPAIYMQFTYNPANIPAGLSANNLVVAFYNTSNGQWVTVPAVVNTVTHTITAKVSHFTDYAVLSVPPATSASALTTTALLETKLTTVTTSPPNKIDNWWTVVDIVIITVVVSFILVVAVIAVGRKNRT
jgi:hypothetical protein